MSQNLTDPQVIAHQDTSEIKEMLLSCKIAKAGHKSTEFSNLAYNVVDGLNWWIRLYRAELRRRLC